MAKTDRIQLTAEKREGAGKGVARALRREKRVPAVIYGDNKEPLTIHLPAREITKEYYKGGFFNNLTDITLDGETYLVLARDVQVNPISEHLIHADFLRVTPKTRISVAIPVEFVNEEKSPGLQEGGVLNVIRYEIELNCRATEIPDHVEVDLTGLDIGDTLKISSVELPEGTKPTITDRDFTIASIAAPRALVEEEPEEEELEEGESAEGEEGAASEGDAAEAGEGDEGAEKEDASE